MFEVLILASLIGQCGPNGCPFPEQGYYGQGYYVPQQARKFEWLPIPSHEEQCALYLNNVQVGVWSYPRKAMCQKQGESWSDWVYTIPEGCPQPPERSRGSLPDWQTDGVDCTKVTKQPSYSINGLKTGKAQVVQALGFDGTTLPNDAQHLRLSVIGPKNLTTQVVKDFMSDPAFADVRGGVVIQSYEPNDVMVTGINAKTDGQPSIYLQSPDGKVLHRQDTYTGPKPLSEAVRKAKSGYDPSKDPNLGPQSLDGILKYLKDLPPIVWLVAAGVGLFLFGKQPTKGV